MEPHWTIIANPATGGGRLEIERPQLEALLAKADIPVSWQLTQAPRHAIALTREAIQQGSRHLLVIGGDGTFSEVVNGVMTQSTCPSDAVTLALIPLGTGNDWARMHKIPTKSDKAVALLQNGQDCRQDIGEMTFLEPDGERTQYFNNVMGLGVEAQIVEDALPISKHGFWGQFAYIRTLVKTLFRYQAGLLQIQTPEREFNHPCLVLTIGICRYNGGGMKMVPQAVPDDGLFDITIVEAVSFWNVLRHILKLYNGRIYAHPRAHHWRSQSLLVEADPSSKVEADGELLGTTKIKVRVIPGALSFIGPESQHSKSVRHSKG